MQNRQAKREAQRQRAEQVRLAGDAANQASKQANSEAERLQGDDQRLGEYERDYEAIAKRLVAEGKAAAIAACDAEIERLTKVKRQLVAPTEAEEKAVLALLAEDAGPDGLEWWDDDDVLEQVLAYRAMHEDEP